MSTTRILADALLRERRAITRPRRRRGPARSPPRTRAVTATRSASMPPCGLPDAFLESGRGAARARSSRASPARAARSRPARRTRGSAIDESAEPELRALEREDKLVRGELRPGGTEREWCDPDVLRRLRRASLAALRREVEPAEQATLGRFLPSWHGVDRRATLREALVPLQALPLPVKLWESGRAPAPGAGLLARASSISCAPPASSSGSGAGLDRVAVFFREDAPVLGQPAGADDSRRARLTTGSARRSGAAPSSGSTCSPRPSSRPRRRSPRSGISSGPARSRTTPGRRCGPAAATASRSPSGARAASRAGARERGHGDAGPLVAHRAPLRQVREARTGRPRRWPSCCWSARASSRATACAARGSPAATGPSTAS